MTPKETFRSCQRSWHSLASFLAVFGNGRRERAYPCVAPQLLRLSHLLGGNMTNRFLFALVVLSSFLEVTFPAGALPVPVATLAIQSTDATGAFILVKKGKGHGDREDRFEWRRHGAYRFSHHRGHPHGMRVQRQSRVRQLLRLRRRQPKPARWPKLTRW